MIGIMGEKQNLLVLGAGQYGHVAAETARVMDCFEQIDFLDDNSDLAKGKLIDYATLYGEYTSAFVAIGNPKIRMELIRNLSEYGFELPVLVHPQATVMPSAQVGAGTIVEAQAVVNSNCVVGIGCLICAGAVVNHNSVLGDACHIDCGAVVPARSVVPAGTKVPCGVVYQGANA